MWDTDQSVTKPNNGMVAFNEIVRDVLSYNKNWERLLNKFLSIFTNSNSTSAL